MQNAEETAAVRKDSDCASGAYLRAAHLNGCQRTQNNQAIREPYRQPDEEEAGSTSRADASAAAEGGGDAEGELSHRGYV